MCKHRKSRIFAELTYAEYVYFYTFNFIRVLIFSFCTLQTFWLQGGVGGRVGGATPGKTVMGLRVVRCENVSVVGDNDETVLVRPGTNLGLGWAFARSFIKNLVLAIFIPGSYAFLYFRFNRAAYDMICNTIVVEEPVTRHRPHQN